MVRAPLVRNRAIAWLCCEYCCGLSYYHHRLDCSARDPNTVNRFDACASLMRQWPIFFCAGALPWGYRFYAGLRGLGRVGFKTALGYCRYWVPLVSSCYRHYRDRFNLAAGVLLVMFRVRSAPVSACRRRAALPVRYQRVQIFSTTMRA